MLRVIGCVTDQHDMRLVLLAGLICCLACFTSVNMLSRSLAYRGTARTAWLSGAGVVFGCGVWTTHFIAMLAYDTDLMIGYEVMTTSLSLVVSCSGAIAAFRLFVRYNGRLLPMVAAGGILGTSIGAMHFIGVNAMRFHGLMSFDTRYVIASLIAGTALSCLALRGAGNLETLTRRARGAAWLTAAVVSLHFIGMTAIAIQPANLEVPRDLIIGSAFLGSIVVASSALILALSLFGSIVDQTLFARAAREENNLRHLAHHDPLTGLPNRLLCQERLVQMVEDSGFDGGGPAVFCLDLDRFKQVNDLLGHQAGDHLLCQVAIRLRTLVREEDFVARISGDEFVVAMPPPVTATEAAALAERLVATLTEPFVLEDQQTNIGASVGIALCPVDGLTAADLLRNADTALYQAKKEGCGIYRFFEASMNERLRQRQMLEMELRRGIGAGQLELYYQPLLDLRTRGLVAFEALVRWHHPTRGLVPPNEFIPLAEETGLILPLGRWVLDTACREAASWELPLKVAVNVSPIQIGQADLADVVAAILAESGLLPSRLELEVTESVLLRHADQALETFAKLKEQGVSISLDDFGTGYSSLSYLRRFPFNKIKLDRSFIQTLGQDEEAAVITRAIVALGHSLRLTVTAEGVETKEQLEFLEDEDCNQVQGYLIGKPAPAHETERLIHEQVILRDTDGSLDQEGKTVASVSSVRQWPEARPIPQMVVTPALPSAKSMAK